MLSAFRHGTVIRSWLVDLMAAAYAAHPGMDDIPAYVEDTGEVNWLVEDAMEMEVSIPVIAQSVMELIASRDRSGWAARAIALMRHGFGGHPFGKSAAVARHRQTSRLADLARAASSLRGRGRWSVFVLPRSVPPQASRPKPKTCVPYPLCQKRLTNEMRNALGSETRWRLA